MMNTNTVVEREGYTAIASRETNTNPRCVSFKEDNFQVTIEQKDGIIRSKIVGDDGINENYSFVGCINDTFVDNFVKRIRNEISSYKESIRKGNLMVINFLFGTNLQLDLKKIAR